MCVTLNTVEVVREKTTFLADDREPEVVRVAQPEPDEYSVTGWFKWKGRDQHPWHMMFRFTINQHNENAQLLGDRVLGAWVGKTGESLFFTTYSYASLTG